MSTLEAHRIFRDYVHVQDGGAAAVLPASDTFWQDLASGAYPQLDQGRLLTAFSFSAPWSNWERHPAGEELVMLLAGTAVLLLERAGSIHEAALASPGDYVLVPAGTWHTARTSAPTTLLFLTPGAGTEHRPVQS